MNRKLDLVCVVLAVLAASACGGDDSDKPAAQTSDFSRYLDRVCEKMKSCGGQAAEDSALLCDGGIDVFLCGSNIEHAQLPSVDGCLKAIKTLSCEDLVSGKALPDACAKLEDDISVAEGNTVGKIGEGCNLEEAQGSQVCAHDAYCDGSEGQCGTCVALKANGKPCSSSDECKSDHCASDDTCQDVKPMGAACEDSWDCEDACIDGKCAREPEVGVVGNACDDENPCGDEGSDDYRCVEGKCAEKLPGGAACTKDEDCSIGCEAGKCVESAACGEGEIGDHCDALFSDGQCKPGLVCGWESGTCQKPVPLNGVCADDVECVDGAYCADFEENDDGEFVGTCKELLPDGRACESSYACQSGTCDQGTCAPLELCSQDTQKLGRAPAKGRDALRRARLKTSHESLPKLLRLRPGRTR